jgi:hypothetical protein
LKPVISEGGGEGGAAAGLAATALGAGATVFLTGAALATGFLEAGFGLAAFLGVDFPPTGRAGLTTVFPALRGAGLAAGLAAFLGAGFPFLGAGFETFFFLIAIQLAFF